MTLSEPKRARSTWVRCAFVAPAAAIVFAAASAAGEPGVLDASTASCRGLDGAPRCRMNVECSDGNTCHILASGEGYCLRADSLLCCDTGQDCAAVEGGTVVCTFVPDLTGRVGICLEVENRYCERFTVAQIIDCQTTPAPSAILTASFDDGDCDRDGLPNGYEQQIGIDECEARGPIAVDVGGTCIPTTLGCRIGEPCVTGTGDPGRCETDIAERGAGTFCRADEPVLYCCGDGLFGCPPFALSCVSNGGAVARCLDDEVCADTPRGAPGVRLDRCIRTPDGVWVPFPFGDCDIDGVANQDDPTVCGEPPPFDAGPELDAGRPIIRPQFRGGGGCVCGSSARGRTRSGLFAAAAFLALAILKKRQRR